MNTTTISVVAQRNRICKVLLLTCSVAIAFVFTSPAHGQGIPFKPKVYVGGGYAPVVSPDVSFKDIYNPSYSFQAAVGIPLSPGFELVGKFQYHNFNIHYDGFPALSGIQSAFLNSLGLTDPGRTITMLGIDAKLPFGPPPFPLRPYFLFGAGSFTLKQNAVSQTVTFGNPPQTITIESVRRNETDLYFNIGFGADIQLGPTLGLFIEGKYAILNTLGESSGLTPVIVGLRLF